MAKLPQGSPKRLRAEQRRAWRVRVIRSPPMVCVNGAEFMGREDLPFLSSEGSVGWGRFMGRQEGSAAPVAVGELMGDQGDFPHPR